MGEEVRIITQLHKSTKRDYIGRMNDDKIHCMEIARKYGEEYWDGNTVRTPFRKQIADTSEHHALNYLVQSTAAELTLKQALKLEYLLRTRSAGSNIAFLIHDAVVLDMKKEDENLIKPLIALMSSTNFGTFKVNIKRGKTLGSMKDMHIG